MTLTDRQVSLIETSFAQIRPISGLAAELFYSNLFSIAPEVQPLFRSDMKRQGEKLMNTLGFVVDGLRDLDTVLPVARNLAARHVAWGVTPKHYEPVGDALIVTLSQGLQEAFTDEVREAWESAYALLAGAMVESAYPRAGTPAAAGMAAE